MNPSSRAAAYAVATAAIAAGVYAVLLTDAWSTFAMAAWSIFWRTALLLLVVDCVVLGALELSLRHPAKKEHKR